VPEDSQTTEWQVSIDASGLLCPLPVLRARKRLLSMQGGEVLALRATDPAAIVDVPHFCSEAGHTFLDCRDEGDSQLYLIRCGASDQRS
jgi:tRNA 2-thiouridine synthesizing protein A